MRKLSDIKSGKDGTPGAPALSAGTPAQAAFAAKSVPEGPRDASPKPAPAAPKPAPASSGPVASAKPFQAPAAVEEPSGVELPAEDVQDYASDVSAVPPVADEKPTTPFLPVPAAPEPVAVSAPAENGEVLARLTKQFVPPAPAAPPVVSPAALAPTVHVAQVPAPQTRPLVSDPAQPAQAGGVAAKHRKITRNQLLVGVAAVAAIVVTGILAQDCSCESKKAPPAQVCPDLKPKDCKSPEAGQPYSQFFDAKCFYCGELEKGPDGKEVPGKFKKGDWMTRDNCPVVFHCGNNDFDVNASYAVYKPVKETVAGVEKVKYVLSTTTVTEKCDDIGDPSFCKEACPIPKETVPAPAVTPKPKRDRPVVEAPKKSKLDCVKSRVEQVRSDINTQVRLAQGEIFKALKLNGDLTVNYGITVQPSGKIVATKISVNGTDVSKFVSLAGIQADNQATEVCHFESAYKINASR